MLEHITGDDLFAQILLLRAADPRTLVLVEGGSDCDALDPHIDPEVAQSLPGRSKQAVERAIALVDEKQHERVVALVDRDWDGDLTPMLASSNVCYTDLYDLDATIILMGDVLERVLSSLADRQARSAHVDRLGLTERELLIRLSGVVGIARYVSVRDCLEVRFAEFPAHSCIDVDQGVVNISEMAVVAVGRSKSPCCDAVQLAEQVRAELGNDPDLERHCNGHDVAAHISALIKAEWGGAKLSAKMVEKVARAAFDGVNLRRTRFFKAISEWAGQADTRVWLEAEA